MNKIIEHIDNTIHHLSSTVLSSTLKNYEYMDSRIRRYYIDGYITQYPSRNPCHKDSDCKQGKICNQSHCVGLQTINEDGIYDTNTYEKWLHSHSIEEHPSVYSHKSPYHIFDVSKTKMEYDFDYDYN